VTPEVQVSAGSGYDLGYQVVWCRKYRRPVVAGSAAGRCEELICAKTRSNGWRMAALQVMPDDMHLLVKAHPPHSPFRITGQFKGLTSWRLWAALPHVRSNLPNLWSRSYVAVTAGAVPGQAVRRFTGNQHERPWRTEGAR
jgi:putative transposase